MVWSWVQQHRWLSVLALVIIVFGTAGGTAWALVFRTVSSPINLRDALRLYRRDAGPQASPLNTWRSRLPLPGVYAYRSSGGESLSIMGVRRSFPARSAMIVTDGTCASVTWAPVVQHTETTTVCPTAGGGYTIPTMVTHESIGGSTTTSTTTCASPLYLLPPTVKAGQRWSSHCTLSDPGEPVAVSGVALGLTNLTIGGQRVEVEHVRLTQHYAGAATGTNPADYWVVPSSGLIAREKEMVDVTQSGVRYHQDSDARLTSLTSAR